MCIFTNDVEKVNDTCIYARADGSRQALVYSMQYGARAELAMVLPIPVPPASSESAVKFINLEGCPDFFEQMRAGFPTRYVEEDSIGLSVTDEEVQVRPLRVHDVGAFEASFVPSPADFGRLDERFRLPADIWLRLRDYADWGFAVFKLKPAERARVHPMAFDFPRRDVAKLFFPTLHVHHRAIEPRAEFDHMLYCQPEAEAMWHLNGWEDSIRPAGEFIRCEQARRLVDPRFPCWRLPLEGLLENRDTWIGPGEQPPG